MRPLPIVWQRLVSEGETCRRCGATHAHLQSAVAKLKEMLAPMNVEPVLEVRAIDGTAFKHAPAESNRIWIAGKSIEEWLGAGVGSSPCCSVCGDTPCRTVEMEGAVFEEIPEALIVRAALAAATALIRRRA